MHVVHCLVSKDGSGYVFHVRDSDHRDFIDGFISPAIGELRVGSSSRGDLDAAEVLETLAAWKLAAEIVQLHAQCFIWRLEFQVEFPTGEIRDITWHIWAPTREIVHERMLNALANDPAVCEADKVVCAAAWKGMWVRA